MQALACCLESTFSQEGRPKLTRALKTANGPFVCYSLQVL